MAPPKIYRAFSFKTVSNLTADPNNCLDKIQNVRTVSLPLGCNVHQAIHRLLEEDIGKYSVDFEGIALAFDHVRILQSNSSILEDIPYMLSKFSVDFIVFKAIVGSTLAGTVSNTSNSHINCLVHGCFNASLKKSRDCDVDNNVRKGYKVAFEVLDLTFAHRMVQIKGRLLEILEETPAEDEVDVKVLQNTHKHFEDLPEVTETEKVVRKRKRNEDAEVEASESPKKKKKKRNEEKHDEDAVELEDCSDSEVKSPTKKSRKKKRNKEKCEESSTEMEFNVLSETEIGGSLECQSPTNKGKKKRTKSENGVVSESEINLELERETPSKTKKKVQMKVEKSQEKLKSHLISESESEPEASQNSDFKIRLEKKKKKHNKEKLSPSKSHKHEKKHKTKI